MILPFGSASGPTRLSAALYAVVFICLKTAYICFILVPLELATRNTACRGRLIVMEPSTRTALEKIHSADRELQNQAFVDLLAATEQPVDWAYEAWDGLVIDLHHPDNHVRAIAAQLLCNLAKSDPEKRILGDFGVLLDVTKDERFVTARHCMQALWKVGVVGKDQRDLLLNGLEHRFNECSAEKNCTLIRFDILQSLRNVYDVTRDETIRGKAMALIETEPDGKYRKKYTGLWRKR